MQDELTSLLGVKVALAPPFNQPISKEEYFGQTSGTLVLARLELSGELAGECYLLLARKDAIRLGGTLIMLPPDGLEEVLSTEEYGGETRDAFGEIANIISGALTSTFEEQYSTPVRFIRTDQETVSPPQVDPDADTPFPRQGYYQMSTTMALGDRQLGDLHLLFPALTFGLVEEEQSAAAAAATSAAGRTEEVAVPAETAAAETAAPVADPAVDPEKQRKLVDRLMQVCREKSGEEVAALLGVKFVLSGMRTDLLSKGEALELLDGKQIMARMTMRGEVSGEGYLLTSVGIGVRLGGTLIMLPPDELDQAVAEDRFEGEAEDAYGEICNIVTGAFTGVFEEMYRKQLGFVREGMELILPVRIDPDSDEVMPNQLYYVAIYGMSLDGKDLGSIYVILPAAALDLQKVQQTPLTPAAAPGKKPVAASGSAAAPPVDGVRRLQPLEGEGPELLVVSEVENEGQAISTMLRSRGFAVRLLHSRDSFNDYLPGEVQGVFLVMREVGEQGFGVAIKLHSVCGGQLPFIICGPAWTRSKVLQAVRYGANDILITPAGPEDIDEKIARNISPRKAA